MRPAVVIMLVIALTILLFEEAFSRISRPKLKQKVKRLKVSRPKTKLTRQKHTRVKHTKLKTPKKLGAGAAEVHKHRGHGVGGLYATQVVTESVSSLGTAGSGIASTVLQNQAARNADNGEAADSKNEDEQSESRK
uniref:Uncharacterized protein n=1 Tax=Rhipicephalus zambeziensis TaxID=60191 RepID=A0A224YKP6_9ACAR